MVVAWTDLCIAMVRDTSLLKDRTSKAEGSSSTFRYLPCQTEIKSKISLISLYYAKGCNELAAPISASLCTSNTALFEKNVEVEARR